MRRTTVLNVSAVTLASGLKLSFAEQGDTLGPTVLLLPGPTDSWRSYEPVLVHLPGWMRVIAVSQRGHGESDKPDAGYAIEDFADDVVGLLNALRIDRAVLVGHSGSCLVARKVALGHPQRVAGLILEASPGTLRDDARARSFVESVISTLDDPISPEFARTFVTATSSNVPAAMIDVFVEETLRVPTRVWAQMFTDLVRYDDTNQLERIKAPVLLIWGDSDPLITRNTQNLLLRALSTANLIVYPAVGHTPRWEDPVRFSHDLTAFAHKLEHHPPRVTDPTRRGTAG